MVVEQGEVWWADLGRPQGSEPGYVRPVVVVQCDSLNRSALRTYVCVAMTGRMSRGTAPGNIVLPPRVTGLPRESVVNVSHIVTLDQTKLIECTGRLSAAQLDAVFRGIDVVLGRS